MTVLKNENETTPELIEEVEIENKQEPKNSLIISMSWDLPESERWKEYAKHFNDDSASHSARLGQSLTILSLVEEKKFNRKLDKVLLLGGAIFHDFEEYFTDSINHSTKNDELLKDDIFEIEMDYKEKILSFFSPSLQPFFKDFLYVENEDTYEGRLLIAADTLDAMLFCYREMTEGIGSRFFERKFQELYNELREVKIDSIQWFLDEFDKKEGVYRFFLDILNLDKIKRWGGKRNLIRDNDTTHTFRTTVLVTFNAYYEQVKYGKEINMFKLLARMLFHDLPERKGGDIRGPLKHSTPERKKKFAEHEKRNAQLMIADLPEFLREDFVDFMIDAKADDYEGELVDIADKLDALLKAYYEMEYNERKYRGPYKKMLAKIQRNFYQHEHVKFFLSIVLLDISYCEEDDI